MSALPPAPPVTPLIPPRDCTFALSDWHVLVNYWYPIATSEEVADQPFAAKLLDQRLVVYRTPQGVSVANDICLHRGVPLSMGWMEEGELVCKYHGLRYNAAGQCVAIPAHPGTVIPPKLCLKSYPAVERYGLVWTCLGTPAAPLPALPEWDDPAYQRAVAPPIDLNAAAGRQVEGFLDVAHFAWIHHRTFGDRNNPVVPNYAVSRTETGLKIEYLSTVGNYLRQDGTITPAEEGVARHFEAMIPFTGKLTAHLPNGARFIILDTASPVSARKTRLFAPLLRNYDLEQPLQPFIDYNVEIFNEDSEIVQAQYPEDLPLDLTEEVHIRADKTSIAYRQELARIGLGRAYTS